MPTFFNAVTELVETGSPERAATPAETTFQDFSGSGWALSAWRNIASAIGLRQMLAVQTVTMVPGVAMQTVG